MTAPLVINVRQPPPLLLPHLFLPLTVLVIVLRLGEILEFVAQVVVDHVNFSEPELVMKKVQLEVAPRLNVTQLD